MAYTPKLVIIHVGYTLSITDEVKKIITDRMPNCKIKTDPTTAILYMKGQDEMSSWYKKRAKADSVAFLKGIYVNERTKVAVGHFTIDGTHVWTTLTDHPGKPIDVKKNVSKGSMGDEILVERMSIKCTAYKFEDHERLPWYRF